MTDIYKIEPPFYLTNATLLDKLYTIVSIILVAIALVVMFVLGIPVVAIGLLFTTKTGEVNEFGWQMENLPKILWPWGNDYDGVQGQKNGKSRNPFGWKIGSYLSNFWWAAIRNPANNFSRYTVGFDYNKVKEIAQDGNWWYVYTDKFTYTTYRTPKWVLGWKITPYRWSDRPWCGATFQKLSGGK